MSMGIVSNDDFIRENESLNPPIKPDSKPRDSDSTERESPGLIEEPKLGRGEGSVEVPNSLRKLIGQTAVESGRGEAIELGKLLGISPSSVSAYSHGSTSTSSYEERPNKGTITKSKERISKRARIKLMLALHHITDEKLSNAKVRDLAGIAKDMSTVVRQMDETANPDKEKEKGPTFVFYSPKFRQEDVFDVVQTKE